MNYEGRTELTENQIRILHYAWLMYPDPYICEIMDITPEGLRYHWKVIHTVLGAENRPHAISIAKALGVVG